MAWYFRHDYSARNDSKIAELEMEMGDNIGYSMWFKLLEIMGEMGGSLPKEKMRVVAYALRVPLDVLLQFVRICVRIELLTDNGDEYMNERFAKDCAKIKDTSEKASNSAKIRWSKPEPATKPNKPKAEPKPDPETNESARVRSMIADLEAEFGAQKISNLSNAEAAKIVKKYGDHVPFALRIFYLWKVSKGKRVKSDYLSLLAPWVQDEVAKEQQRKDTAPKPEPPQRVKTPEEIALGEERRKMIMERAGFGK